MGAGCMRRRGGMGCRRGCMHRRGRVGSAFEYRRGVRCGSGRVLDGSWRVLNRSGRMLNRSRRVLDRSRRVSRLLDYRSARTAVARRNAAGALAALNDRARVRRRCPMATNRAGRGALDGGVLAGGSGRAVLSRDATAVYRTAGPERSTFLAEYLAVRPSASSAGRSRAGLGTHASPTGEGTRRLRCCVASERSAVAAQDVGGTFATDAQPCAARGTNASLATDADTRQRARHMRGGSAVQGGAFASDQPRLTARADTQTCVATNTDEATGVARTGQPGTGRQSGLATETAPTSQATATGQTAAKPGARLTTSSGAEPATGLTTNAPAEAAAGLATQARTTAKDAAQSALATGSTSQTNANPGTEPASSLTTNTSAKAATRLTSQVYAATEPCLTAKTKAGTATQTSLTTKTKTSPSAQTSLSTQTNVNVETELGAQTDPTTEAFAETGTDAAPKARPELARTRPEPRPELAGTRPEPRPEFTSARSAPGPELAPPMPELTPARPVLTPARSETGTRTKPTPARPPAGFESAITRSELTETGLPAVPKPVRGCAQVTHESGAVHEGRNGVVHQRGAILRDRGNEASAVPVAAVPIVGRIAVLVGQDLLQSTHWIPSKVLTW